MSPYLYKYNYLLGFRIGLTHSSYIGDINKDSLKLCSVLVIVALKSNMVAAPIKTKDLESVLVSVGAIVGNDLFYVLNLNNITSAIGNPLDA